MPVWKGLSPSVENTPDNYASSSGPSQSTEGDVSVSGTGTALVFMHLISVWFALVFATLVYASPSVKKVNLYKP